LPLRGSRITSHSATAATPIPGFRAFGTSSVRRKTQREPGDAAVGELVEDLVVGELGVEDQQSGVAPVAVFQ